MPLLRQGTHAMSEPVSNWRHKEVASRFNVSAVLGEKANRSEVLRLMSHTRVLHFTTHGEFNFESPLNSSILLNPEQTKLGKTTPHSQNILRARDFLSHGLDASLVVLSACQTGLNRIFPLDEIEGFSESIIYSGAESIILSLWSVDSVATRIFMRVFYELLEEVGKPKAIALKLAAKHVRELSLDDVNGGEIMYRQGGSRAEMWRLKSVPPVAFNQERPNLTEGGLDAQRGYLPPCSQGLFRRRDERPRGGPSVRATPGHGAQDARVLRAPRVSTATTGSQTEARSI